MTVNKCSKQYQLRDKISSFASFCFASFFYAEFDCRVFFSRFFFLSLFWFFLLFTRHQLQSLLQLCLKTVSRKAKQSFSSHSCKAVFASAKTHIAFRSVFKFHPVFRWIFKRQRTAMKKRFFRLRISKDFFHIARNFHLWSKQRVFKEACRCLRLLFSIACNAQKTL